MRPNIVRPREARGVGRIVSRREFGLGGNPSIVRGTQGKLHACNDIGWISSRRSGEIWYKPEDRAPPEATYRLEQEGSGVKLSNFSRIRSSEFRSRSCNAYHAN